MRLVVLVLAVAVVTLGVTRVAVAPHDRRLARALALLTAALATGFAVLGRYPWAVSTQG